MLYTEDMYIAILGRQPDISMAELERRYGSENVRWFSSTTATIDTPEFKVEELGGTIKAGTVVSHLPRGNWRQVSQNIIAAYSEKWRDFDGKITLGISAYDLDVSAREVQKIGIVIKKNLKKQGVNLRLIPNAEPSLGSATSHHNKLGLAPNKVELLIVSSQSNGIIVAESNGTQNITALAARDQGRPKRDAFVGMLPPKLALLMLNLAAAEQPSGKHLRVLDPFCGTGVVLQEAALRGYDVYGTDLSEKMIDYTKINLEWLQKTKRIPSSVTVHQGDAMNSTWQAPIDLVVSEVYLGQPFSAPPSPAKLEEVRGNVNHITTTFLKNLHSQLQPGTPLCLAVPAWRDASGSSTHLPFIRSLSELGFERVPFSNIRHENLLYYREDQVVARELLVLVAA